MSVVFLLQGKNYASGELPDRVLLPGINLGARWIAEVTNSHPEGVEGAESVAAIIFLAWTGHKMDKISEYVIREFGYSEFRADQAPEVAVKMGIDLSSEEGKAEMIYAPCIEIMLSDEPREEE